MALGGSIPFSLRHFARSLNEEKYKVVFIPDTNDSLSYDTRLHQYEVVPSASTNIELRFAIFRNSHVVLGVPC